jgi:phosphosulfolactate phosphohydrolase-like enzyme
MKLNELILDFYIATTNEEKNVLKSINGVRTLESFEPREQVIITSLIRKSLVSKVHNNGNTLVVKNEQLKSN